MAENNIERVLIGGADIHGQFRAKFIPSWRFDKEPEAPMHIADVMAIMDIEDEMMPRPAGHTGWWPTWESGFDDLDAIPDLSTLTPVPWIENGALVLCDYYDLDHQPLPAMPRNVLKSVIARCEAMGFEAKMATEYEFFIFRESFETAKAKGFRNLTPLGEAVTMYGAERAHADLPITQGIEKACAGMGIDIEAIMAEGGPSQFELNLTPQSALRAADEGFLFKFAVKRVAEQFGHFASFLPKFGSGEFGSSLHVHQSLWAGDRNVFYDGSADDRLSSTARHYIAGMQKTLREFTAVFAPFITSYKRFEEESAAGTQVAWAVGNRTTALRAVKGSEGATRIENRTPGSDGNSYLVLAAMLAGGLWGIENELDPGPAYEGNAYADESLERVPSTLAEAVEIFAQSEVANKFFGEEAVTYFAESRRWEVAQFNNAVTDWELARYIGTV
ncbi:glutamine synthetase family protein [Gordonia McavH-238-E]|uniref:glutamine synthetase family protein n=1 Tax=Gordonia sp. McavH-238-E TaxID=2917736 RepID=UPI001EF6208E|nr:glutamine synthetase family protein [Gordonia sp. McavH-238-E]MCG7632917.1 glutamine synthetase family protein [Gordonia sp. McavH-238-E]